MQSPAPSVGAETPIAVALARLQAESIPALAVLDGAGRTLGLFSWRGTFCHMLPRVAQLEDKEAPVQELDFWETGLEDARQRLAELARQPVSAVMQQDFVALQEDSPVMEALLKLCRGQPALPVLDAGGRLAGMIYPASLLAHLHPPRP